MRSFHSSVSFETLQTCSNHADFTITGWFTTVRLYEESLVSSVQAIPMDFSVYERCVGCVGKCALARTRRWPIFAKTLTLLAQHRTQIEPAAFESVGAVSVWPSPCSASCPHSFQRRHKLTSLLPILYRISRAG